MIRLHLAMLCLLSVCLGLAAAESSWQPEPTGSPLKAKAEKAMAAFDSKSPGAAPDDLADLYAAVAKYSRMPDNRARALVGQGDALVAAGDPWKAFQVYEQAVTSYGNLVQVDDILKKEYTLATDQLANGRQRWYKIFSSGNEKAIKVYDHIVKSAPYSSYAPLALFRSGTVERWEKNYTDAVERYSRLITKFPDSRLSGYAMVEMADTLVEAADASDGDGTLTTRARSALDRFFKRYPNHPRMDDARRLLEAINAKEADRLLYMARFYQRQESNRPEATLRYLQTIVKDYGETPAADEARAMLAALTGEEVKPTSADTMNPTAPPPAVVPPGETPPTPPAVTTTTPNGASAAPSAPAPKKPPVELPTRTPKNEKWLLPITDLDTEGN